MLQNDASWRLIGMAKIAKASSKRKFTGIGGIISKYHQAMTKWPQSEASSSAALERPAREG